MATGSLTLSLLVRCKERRVKKQLNWAVLVTAGLACHALPAFPRQKAQESQKPAQSSIVVSGDRSGGGDRSTPAGPSARTSPDYLIGADDVLDVNVWKEQELTRTVQVRPDGKISMPLLNDVQAVGLTPFQLAQSIAEKLKKYLTSPRVTVMVTQINSQRVYITGEVTRPGAYAVLPGMTILQAITSAGGLTPFANGKKIFLMRDENGVPAKYPFVYKEVLDGRRAEDNLKVKAGDIIVVP
jgi:polysaccharide biosynthesis/export protein